MNKALLASAIILATATSASAQELETVVTVASRVDTPAINDAQIVVIDRSEIEQSGSSDLVSLLSSKADFQFSRNGGPAHTANLYIKGLDSKQVLFLVNGQRVGSATSGTTDIQLIPVDQIERVEILKGSRSAIYGADAQAGVINVITRMTTSGTSVSATLGTNQTRTAGIRSQIQKNNVTAYINALHNTSDGYDLDIDSKNDTDGYERNGINAGVGYALSESQSLNFDLQINRGSYDYDNAYSGTDQADFDNRAYTLGYVLTDDLIQLRAQAGRSYDRSWNYGNGVTRSNGADLFGSRKDAAEVTGVFHLTDQYSVITGIDTRTVTLNTRPTEYDEDFERNNGALLALRFENDFLAIETGARFDDNSNYGEFTSFNTAAKLSFDNGDTLAIGQSTAFRAPTFNDLYYPASMWGDYSNEDLEPETSRIWTLDYTLPIEAFGMGGTFLLSGQRATFNNQIAYDETFYPYNIGRSYVNYASATWEQNWTQSFGTELIQEWTEARNMETDELIPRRPVRASKANLNWNYRTITSRLETMYRDTAPSFAGDDIPAFFVASTSVTWQIKDEFAVSARIDNLTDRDYETVPGYGARGRYAQITGRYDF